VAALWGCELDYFHCLLEQCGSYNEFYPKINLEGELTQDYLWKATAMMASIGITPTAVFMPEEDLEKRLIVEDMGMKCVNPVQGSRWGDPSIYVFGVPKLPDLVSAHIVDDRVKFRLKTTEKDYTNLWQEP